MRHVILIVCVIFCTGACTADIESSITDQFRSSRLDTDAEYLNSTAMQRAHLALDIVLTDQLAALDAHDYPWSIDEGITRAYFKGKPAVTAQAVQTFVRKVKATKSTLRRYHADYKDLMKFIMGPEWRAVLFTHYFALGEVVDYRVLDRPPNGVAYQEEDAVSQAGWANTRVR